MPELCEVEQYRRLAERTVGRTIVAVEAPYRELFRQNRARAARVPEKVIERMSGRWELPDATEAHVVEHHFVDEAAGWRPN